MKIFQEASYLFLILSFGLSLAGCGGGKKSPSIDPQPEPLQAPKEEGVPSPGPGDGSRADTSEGQGGGTPPLAPPGSEIGISTPGPEGVAPGPVAAVAPDPSAGVGTPGSSPGSATPPTAPDLGGTTPVPGPNSGTPVSGGVTPAPSPGGIILTPPGSGGATPAPGPGVVIPGSGPGTPTQSSDPVMLQGTIKETAYAPFVVTLLEKESGRLLVETKTDDQGRFEMRGKLTDGVYDIVAVSQKTTSRLPIFGSVALKSGVVQDLSLSLVSVLVDLFLPFIDSATYDDNDEALRTELLRLVQSDPFQAQAQRALAELQAFYGTRQGELNETMGLLDALSAHFAAQQ